MVDLHSLVDKLFCANRREYSVRNGGTAYLDASPLNRPITMPIAQKIILAVIIIAAIVIGGFFVNDTVFANARAVEKAEKTIAANLARPASLESIPNMASLVLLSDDEIRAAFNQAGYNIYDASSMSEDNSLILWKMPDDVSVEQAALMISQGIKKLDPEQATLLLNGSWKFESDRVNGTSMVVRYADFTTGDPQVAIRSALEKEGFDANNVESGVDDSGNSFSTGGVDVNGTQCTWRISAVPLSDYYAISGMPENACYVGVRITVQ
jgi:hypothetical protein